MALFDDYLAPRQFGEGGGLLGRLLALQQQQNQYQPGAGFDTAPVPQMAPPTPWSNLPGDRASSGERSAAPNLNSQYRALRSVLGDHNAMLATVDPETRKALVAQSLAGQQGVLQRRWRCLGRRRAGSFRCIPGSNQARFAVCRRKS
jgi:hypothetical protein